jgi:beta-1,4-N-acetylglucosaminyltransferase
MDDIINSDLIITHAGTGTILECLRHRNKVIAIVNTKLMENHQMEIASRLFELGCLIMCSDLN